MTRYFLWRLLQGVFVVWAAYTLTFVVLFALPSDPVSIMLGPNNLYTPEDFAIRRHELGLDRSVPVQYFISLGHLFQGDLGRSVQSGQPVSDMIAEALPQTAAMAGLGLLLGALFGVGLALATSLTRWRWLRQVLLTLPPAGVAVPGFLIGLLLLHWFSFQWNLFPALGNEGWRSLVLPAATISIQPAAVIAQILARSLDNELRQNYVDTARAKGAGPVRVNVRHALRNAALPTLTIAGLLVGGLLAGAIVAEVVFSRNGLGQISQTAVSSQDLPVVQGVVLLGSAIFVVINLLVDLLYPLLDPRITQVRRQPRSQPVTVSL
ncbi:peptide ABC transporter permease [Parafrankia colletiae]|uniref:Peptide ABC transporter permease n=1 Tax=Parafrankia colletiae TaxID=573497 RepID=A0A1S1QHG6_9ACTN|nr:ABC transporter permease [Parafrankia colletiae]MCK9901931.1 ABC transporter permease [Frankia sp. Cpl3]OHV32881.1 peptide ABC transporter permease [Parafrankia colletiae]